MKFHEALYAGGRTNVIRRRLWAVTNAGWVLLRPFEEVRRVDLPDWLLRAFDRTVSLDLSTLDVVDHFYRYLGNAVMQVGWQPSVEDVLADDWEVYAP